MNILVDKNNPFVAEAFSDYGDVRVLATPEFTTGEVRDADALVIRSETKITRELLQGSRVRFVGSATIGTDHVDLDYLATQGIGFASAPGCNANSVAEYFVAALLRYAAEQGISLVDKTIGVVGVGNVGSKVVMRSETLGLRVLHNDPPRGRATGDPRFLDLDDLMDSDFVTLHVPLTKGGSDPTYHLFDAKRLARMKRGSVLINTARGAVVETAALKNALTTGQLGAALLDVWENEPAIDPELVPMAHLGTPHIAGYSFDGKLNAVRMIHTAMGKYFGMPARWEPPVGLPAPKVAELSLPKDIPTESRAALSHIVQLCYDIGADHESLRRMLSLVPSERAAYFRRLRAEYPVRREFGATRIRVSRSHAALGDLLRAVGFAVAVEPSSDSAQMSTA